MSGPGRPDGPEDADRPDGVDDADAGTGAGSADDAGGTQGAGGEGPSFGDLDPGASPPRDAPELLTFPTDFPIKVMGKRVDGFADAIAQVVLAYAPDFDVGSMELRASSKGNYIGLTVTIRATSREQLDALYRALSGHPMVSVVL